MCDVIRVYVEGMKVREFSSLDYNFYTYCNNPKAIRIVSTDGMDRVVAIFPSFKLLEVVKVSV